jgi:hypothetical protein
MGASVKTAVVPPMSVVIPSLPIRVKDGLVSTHDGGPEPTKEVGGDFACVDVDGKVPMEGVNVDLDESASGPCVDVDGPDLDKEKVVVDLDRVSAGPCAEEAVVVDLD